MILCRCAGDQRFGAESGRLVHGEIRSSNQLHTEPGPRISRIVRAGKALSICKNLQSGLTARCAQGIQGRKYAGSAFGNFPSTIAYCLVGSLGRTTMYCNYCGKVIQDDAAVCAYCGIRVGASVARKRLVRPRQGRKVAGVCLGFAEYFDIDVTVVRVVWLITSFMTGIGLISYPIAWIVMPEEPLLLAAPVGAQRVTNP